MTNKRAYFGRLLDEVMSSKAAEEPSSNDRLGLDKRMVIPACCGVPKFPWEL